MKILIAEDDLITCRILEKNIESWGYEVVLARSGGQAWQALKDSSLRLAILDWMMPGMDGIEICKKIRRRKKYKYTYIILLSAKDRKQDIIAGLSSGADDYMAKPVNFLELRARLQTGKRIIDLEDKLLYVQNQLKDLASRDSLTKLWNRVEISKFLREELDRTQREKKPLGVIMVDVDYFKKINDLFGHNIGDLALLQVVSRIKRKVRRSDKVGRYGGDEIIVILPNCGLLEIKKIAERLRASIARRGVKTGEETFPVTISAGCASSENRPHASAESLIKAADAALLKAKNQGRNCVFVDDDVTENTREVKNV
ncbi:MAG: diguanylate cyclase [Clostridiales bacterium]|jgi:diguanylate cyclase (GGDEF)-like protein|nr:diguanylate cyclase [Clostridiales bacterium]